MVSLEFWYMLPAAVLIATTAMASGVEGATFFSPLFILVLGLPPEVAIGTGLVTEVFGFDSHKTPHGLPSWSGSPDHHDTDGPGWTLGFGCSGAGQP